jgi:sporulation protein YlmC with PRC-barrel domain
MRKHLLLTAFAVGSPFFVGSAFADGASMGGITMSDHASSTVHYATMAPADMMSSKLVGMDVYNNQNDKLGQVEDLVVDNGKTISGVVVSVGGFLGMGEHYVLIDPASIVVSDKDGSMKAVVDTNKDNLEAAPTFTYKKKS